MNADRFRAASKQAQELASKVQALLDECDRFNQDHQKVTRTAKIFLPTDDLQRASAAFGTIADHLSVLAMEWESD